MPSERERVEVLPGTPDFTPFQVQAAALEIGQRVIRIEPDRLIEVRESVLVLQCLPIANTAICESHGKIVVALISGLDDRRAAADQSFSRRRRRRRIELSVTQVLLLGLRLYRLV